MESIPETPPAPSFALAESLIGLFPEPLGLAKTAENFPHFFPLQKKINYSCLWRSLESTQLGREQIKNKKFLGQGTERKYLGKEEERTEAFAHVQEH